MWQLRNHSLIAYGILPWRNGDDDDVNIIFVLQKRAYSGNLQTGSMRDKFKEINIFTLASQYILENIIYR